MNKTHWTESEDIESYHQLLREKWHNRSLIDDTIYKLNKLKPKIKQLNLELIESNWTSEEKVKELRRVVKQKELFLKQLITLVSSNKEYNFEYKWNWENRKITLIFYKDNFTCHISHIQVKSIPYISSNIELLKDIISRISDNQLRNKLFLTLKQ